MIRNCQLSYSTTASATDLGLFGRKYPFLPAPRPCLGAALALCNAPQCKRSLLCPRGDTGECQCEPIMMLLEPHTSPIPEAPPRGRLQETVWSPPVLRKHLCQTDSSAWCLCYTAAFYHEPWAGAMEWAQLPWTPVLQRKPWGWLQVPDLFSLPSWKSI